MKYGNALTWFARAAVLLGVAASALACSADASDEDPSTGESSEALSSGSCDRASFAKCVNNRGGGACSKFCSGACRSEVEVCARAGGGQGCVNKCMGSVAACSPREEMMTIATWECGFPFGWGGNNSALPGRANATCTRQCDGSINNCGVWRDGRSRAQCTQGVPLDSNQSPW